MTTVARHDASPQADGDSGVPEPAIVAILRTLAPSPVELARTDLAWALIRSAALEHGVPEPTPKTMHLGSYATFERIASTALALVDDSRVRQAKAEAIQDVCAEHELDILGDEAVAIRDGIERFQAKLAHLGARVTR